MLRLFLIGICRFNQLTMNGLYLASSRRWKKNSLGRKLTGVISAEAELCCHSNGHYCLWVGLFSATCWNCARLSVVATNILFADCFALPIKLKCRVQLLPSTFYQEYCSVYNVCSVLFQISTFIVADRCFRSGIVAEVGGVSGSTLKILETRCP